MRQKQLFLNMERDFGLVKPIFLNTPYGWYDTKLVQAHDLTTLSIGRYRVDLETNVKGVQEFWFDFEWTRYDEQGHPIQVVGRELVAARFLRLRAVLEAFSVHLARLVDLRRVYVRASGTGFHVFFFVQGVSRERWLAVTRGLLRESGVSNTRVGGGLFFGVDFDSVLAVRRKLRETFSPNFDKSRVKRDVGFENFSSTFLLSEFFELRSYPFASSLSEVVSPERYRLATLRKAALGRHRSLAGRVRECPALMRISQEPRTRCWQARNFLVKDLRYLFKMTEEQIVAFIAKENRWDDYDPEVTTMYLHRHFTEGRNESLVKKPIKRSTLMRYGYCKNDCKECVYNKY